jgi:hypothetical protein
MVRMTTAEPFAALVKRAAISVPLPPATIAATFRMPCPALRCSWLSRP